MEGEEDATDDELGKRLATVAMEAAAKGGDGTRASLMATDLSRLSGQTAWSLRTCRHVPRALQPSQYTRRREGRNRLEAYLDRVHSYRHSQCL